MKQKKRIKTVCAVVFVIIAGIVYLSMLKSRDKSPEADFEVRDPAINQVSVIDNTTSAHTEKDEIGKAEISEPEKTYLYVHVCGAVVREGVYSFEQGARIVDAISAAGGITENAAGYSINQAQLLYDGQRLYVPSVEEISGTESNLTYTEEFSETGSLVAGVIDINTANREELMALPGIGAAKADAIVTYRMEIGHFESCEDLMLVPGIKQALYDKISDKIMCR